MEHRFLARKIADLYGPFFIAMFDYRRVTPAGSPFYINERKGQLWNVNPPWFRTTPSYPDRFSRGRPDQGRETGKKNIMSRISPNVMTIPQVEIDPATSFRLKLIHWDILPDPAEENLECITLAALLPYIRLDKNRSQFDIGYGEHLYPSINLLIYHLLIDSHIVVLL